MAALCELREFLHSAKPVTLDRPSHVRKRRENLTLSSAVVYIRTFFFFDVHIASDPFFRTFATDVEAKPSNRLLFVLRCPRSGHGHLLIVAHVFRNAGIVRIVPVQVFDSVP